MLKMSPQGHPTVLVLGMCVLALGVGAATRRPELISAARIHGHMSFLAHDLLEGREAGTRGFDVAATYVAAQFEGMGLEPLASGSYFQEVPLRRVELIDSTLELRTSEKRLPLEPERDFIVSGHPTLENYEADAEVVFVGYGVHAPELGHDDYDGLDVRGKVVAFLDGVPDSLSAPLRGYFQFGTEKWGAAAERGAVSAIRLMTPESTKTVSWEDTVSYVKKGWLGWSDDTSNLRPAWAAVTMSAPGVDALLRETGLPWTQPLAQAKGRGASTRSSGLLMRMRATSRPLRVPSRNVAAILRGRGPDRDQYVVYTAHLDHLGIGRPVDDDAIYNGAVDNASGVAALLCVAEAFVRLGTPPDRSIIFVATTAEEPGLFGSDYFVQRGPIPRKQLVAAINIDGATLMVHPLRDVIAMGAPESTLGEAARSAARSRGLELRSEELPLVGSDHFPFARACVPPLWVIAGQKTGRPDLDGAKLEAEWMATRLHSPKDDMAQPLDFQAAADLAAFDFEVGRLVANGRKAPTWHHDTIVREFLEHRAGGKNCTR
jgi:hypothetical protein